MRLELRFERRPATATERKDPSRGLRSIQALEAHVERINLDARVDFARTPLNNG